MSKQEVPANPGPQSVEEQLAALTKLVERQASTLAVQQDEIISLRRNGGAARLLAPEEVPIYELTDHYYSADDVFYPAGTQIEDIDGSMVPNEQMIPLNEPARVKMERYLRSLPQMGTPNFEFIMDAAMQLRPQEGEQPLDRAAYHAGILQRAMELKARAEGRMPGLAPEPQMPKLPVRRQGVPMMPNTRIKDGNAIGPRDTAGSATLPARNARTRTRQGAQAPADKVAPAMGTVQNLPLGSEPEGVAPART